MELMIKNFAKVKTLKINIHPELQEVEITVRNGKAFTEAAVRGDYKTFSFTTNDNDAARIKTFAVKHGNDNNSNKGQWYAHCNGYAMDLIANYNNQFSLNTYRVYGRAK